MHRRLSLVSFVIPVYGVAPYPPRFLSPLDAQNHPHHHLQVVLVLDRACDDPPRACQNWVWRIDLGVEIIEMSNDGQGRARDLGMERARGQWIDFLDPDDWFVPDFFARLLAAKCYGDILLASRILVHQGGAEISYPLGFHLQDGAVRVNATRQSQAIQLSIHECLIRTDRAPAARFSEDHEAPTFGGALYLGCIRSHWSRIAYVPETVCHHDKQVADDSTVQTAWSRPGRYIAQMRTRCHVLLDAAGGAPQTRQTILYDLGWYFEVVDAGRMPIDPPGLEQTYAAEMHGLAQRLDAGQILHSPWGDLGAQDRVRLLLWEGRPEAAVARDDEIIELCTAEPASRQAEPLRHVGTDVNWVLTGAEAAQRYFGTDVPRVPPWPYRPRLVEPRPTGTVHFRRLLRRCRWSTSILAGPTPPCLTGWNSQRRGKMTRYQSDLQLVGDPRVQ